MDLPILQRPQKLDLQIRRDLSDLVEKQSSPMREFEVPLARSRGPREGSCLVTEHLALDRPLGKRRAVNRHERCGRAGTVGVDGPVPAIGLVLEHDHAGPFGKIANLADDDARVFGKQRPTEQHQVPVLSNQSGQKISRGRDRRVYEQVMSSEESAQSLLERGRSDHDQ